MDRELSFIYYPDVCENCNKLDPNKVIDMRYYGGRKSEKWYKLFNETKSFSVY